MLTPEPQQLHGHGCDKRVHFRKEVPQLKAHVGLRLFSGR